MGELRAIYHTVHPSRSAGRLIACWSATTVGRRKRGYIDRLAGAIRHKRPHRLEMPFVHRHVVRGIAQAF